MSATTEERPVGIDTETLADFYKKMIFIRHFEEKCMAGYRAGKVGGYLHLYIGQEATGVGWMHALSEKDLVIGAYRIHGFALLRGSDPNAVMAELFGKDTGVARGKGGSMHVYDAEKGFYGGWGIVGGHIPLGAGMAFAAKYHNTGQVVTCWLGDGASNAGVFMESMNMASLWDLPVIFIIENNGFAMGTRLEYHAADPDLHKRAEGFAMKHEQLDGMDVEQVATDAERIVNWVRENQKPYLVEIMNYRFVGHGAADNDQALYRTPEEVEQWKERDPVHTLHQRLLQESRATAEQLEQWDLEALRVAEAAYEFADKSPHPPDEAVYEHVYTDMLPEVGH